MAAVLSEDVRVEPRADAVRAAHDNLDSILEAIAQERGVRVALGAAGAVREALDAGLIDGSRYRPQEGYTDSWGDTFGAWPGACVIGHIASYLGVNERGNIHFPGYTGEHTTPIEGLVMDVRPPQTPADSDALATIASWLDSWTRQRS